MIDRQATSRGLTADAVRAELTHASPLHRFTMDAEVAEAVLFLSGSGARGVTGMAELGERPLLVGPMER